MDDYSWIHDVGAVDMDELSSLYRIAPLGSKPPEALATVFGNSMFMCFVYLGGVLVGAGGSWLTGSTAPISGREREMFSRDPAADQRSTDFGFPGVVTELVTGVTAGNATV